MFKYILLISLLLLPSCTLSPFTKPSRMDTVEVVKYTRYTKIHQLYIPREKLYKFKNKSFFKYFYNKKKKKLYILTQNDKYYFLYNVTHPNTKKITINKKKYPYRKLVKKLRTAHILYLKNITPIAYDIEVHFRKLSNIKTLYIKIKNYQKLQKAYKKALSLYETKYIKHLQYILPKRYIYLDYLKSKKNARTDKEKKVLSLIGRKLGFLQKEKTIKDNTDRNNESKEKKISTQPIAPETDTEEVIEEKVIEEENIEKEGTKEETTTEETDIEEVITEKTTAEESIRHDHNMSITKTTTEATPYKKKPPYQYFLLSSNIKEISQYLKEAKRTKSLSATQYKKLLARKIFLKEEYLLQHANIAELIRAYKINQKPTFKKRIMELMKEKQEASTPI